MPAQRLDEPATGRETPVSPRFGGTRRLVAYGVATALPLLYLLGKSTELRPIADDYCSASRVAVRGVVGATSDIFMSWHGGVSANLLVHVLAWPLTVLPWWASYLPFVLITFSVIVAGCGGVLAWGWVPGVANRWSLAVLAPASLLALVIAFWGTGLTEKEVFLTYSMLGWQAASVVHLMPVMLSLMLLVYCLWAVDREDRRVVWVVAVGGLAIANFNLSESLATAAMFAFAGIVGPSILGVAYKRSRRLLFVAAAASVASAAAIYFAPGTRERAESLPQLSIEESVRAIASTILANFRDSWGDVIGSPGIYAAFLVLVPVGALLGKAANNAGASDTWRARTTRRLAFVAITSVVYSLLGTISSLAGEAVTYRAEWHSIAPLAAASVAAVSGGCLLGLWMIEHIPPGVAQAVMVCLMLLAVGVGIRAVHGVGEVFDTRKTAWDAGSAPYGYMVDRESWARGCWQTLVRARAAG